MIGLLSLLGGFILTFQAAETVDRFNVAALVPMLKSKNDYYKTKQELVSQLGLSTKDDLVSIRTLQSVRGRMTEKLQQTFEGMEVIGGSVTADKDPARGYTGTISGEVFRGLQTDIASVQACQQNTNLIQAFVLREERASISQVSSMAINKKVYVSDGKGYLSYEVTFFYMRGTSPSRPCYFVDACTLKVIYKFNNLQNCGRQRRPRPRNTNQCGPNTKAYMPMVPLNQPNMCSSQIRGQGGNVKIGRWMYGTSPFCLSVTNTGFNCMLDNDVVKVVDLRQRTNKRFARTVMFQCSRGYNDGINGACSPALDAMHFGTVSFRMFMDWYNVMPLTMKPTIFVHYGRNFENAFWDGSSITLGDGMSTFYPMAGQDIVAHELAHGVTEQNSNLIYDNQSGGINEAFSDMTGEAVKMFARNYNDWLVGADILKNGNSALRYFDDPTRDGRSLKHVRGYNDNVDVHHSSGIFNHAFYQLVQVMSMSIKDAYECFLRANMVYWSRSTSFEEGACGVVRACYDLGFEFQLVRQAFAVVGITLSNCDTSTFIDTISLSEVLTNLHVSSNRRPLYLLERPAKASSVRMATSRNVQIAVLDQETGEPLSFGSADMKHDFSVDRRPVYVRLFTTSASDITGVTLNITYS